MHNVVSVNLCGGLGNQLFQYAAARALAVERDADLVLDLSWFDEVLLSANVTPRKYALSPFDLPVKLVGIGGVVRKNKSSFSDAIQRLGGRFGLKLGVKQFAEKSFRFDQEILALHPPVKLSGYFQSPRYFESVASLILEEIGLPRSLSVGSLSMLEQIRAANAVCIHVRRGDYVTNKSASEFHGVCSLDYYRRGLETVISGLKSPHAFIFSDDPQWVKDNFVIDMETTVVEVNGPDEPHQDLWLMSACKHFVIANSSLSWWGAWLGREAGKRVIYPAQWFADPSTDTSDLFPSEWLGI